MESSSTLSLKGGGGESSKQAKEIEKKTISVRRKDIWAGIIHVNSINICFNLIWIFNSTDDVLMNWHSLVITKWPFSTIAFTDQIIVVLRDKGGTGSDHICRCCYSYMIDPVDKGPRKKKSNNCITVRRLDKGCEKWDFPHLTQHTTGGAFFFKASKTKTNMACTVSLQRQKSKHNFSVNQHAKASKRWQAEGFTCSEWGRSPASTSSLKCSPRLPSPVDPLSKTNMLG